MSHSNGEVWSLDGNLVAFFEYNGTVDVACGRLYLNIEDMKANWRADNYRACRCEGAGQPVILWTSYGGGFHWPAVVCLNCMAIKDGLDSEPSTDGHPFV